MTSVRMNIPTGTSEAKLKNIFKATHFPTSSNKKRYLQTQSSISKRWEVKVLRITPESLSGYSSTLSQFEMKVKIGNPLLNLLCININ